MKKIAWLSVAILLLTGVSIAASGSGKINSISGYIPETAWLPAGYHITLNPHAPPKGQNYFITQQNVSGRGWKTGDDVNFIDPDASHPCPSKDTDTAIINITRNQWVCAIAAGSF
ncbi:MAG: hypothetical protein ACLPXT_09195 [Terracidiphilus sp.]